MSATPEQLKQILEEASREAARLPEYRRSDDVKRALQELRESGNPPRDREQE
jgi:hypothetical protein